SRMTNPSTRPCSTGLSRGSGRCAPRGSAPYWPWTRTSCEGLNMGALADQLGGKTPGVLIKAKAWNDLGTAVEKIGTDLKDLASPFEKLRDRGDGLDTRLTKLETTVGTLDTALQTLRQRFRRVTLRTSRASFAIGELAEIIAQVTDLEGNALNLAD